MMNERILFVDDDPNILEAYQRSLHSVLRVETAQGGKEGLKALAEQGPFAVVVSDMRMPSMDGIEFLAHVKEQWPDTVRMMLTGNADIEVAVQAINEGNIFRFLIKPCPSEVFGKALVDGINQYRLVTAERELLERTLNGLAELLAEILSWVDPDAFGRTIQLRTETRTLAQHLKETNLWDLELAATLSQIGCMAVPRDLLIRAYAREPLTAEEKTLVTSVPAIGQEIIARIPRLESVARIVLYQQKRFDGAGFPEDSVSGAQIPLGARILKVVLDVLELESGGASRREVFTLMRKRDGWYDPRVLDAAVELHGERAESEEHRPGLALGLSELRAGLTLARNIETTDGRLLIGAGTRVTEVLLIRLRRFARLAALKEPIFARRPPPE